VQGQVRVLHIVHLVEVGLKTLGTSRMAERPAANTASSCDAAAEQRRTYNVEVDQKDGVASSGEGMLLGDHDAEGDELERPAVILEVPAEAGVSQL
jgi:hypothetical protein